MYRIPDTELVSLQEILRRLIKERHNNLSDAELTGRANEILLFNFHGLTYGVLRKIAYSMGAKDLKADYAALLGLPGGTLRDEIVFAAIKLENYSDPDSTAIIKFGRELTAQSPFMREVLRQLVATYRNFAGVTDAVERQKLESEFDLEGAGLGLKNPERGERKYLNTGNRKFQPPGKKK